ncbi:MAG: SpoIID/LytB domain-containing protein [Atribacterota bacterium]
MFRKTVLFLFFLLFFCTIPVLAANDPNVQVLLFHGRTAIIISSPGGLTIQAGRKIYTISPDVKCTFLSEDDRVVWEGHRLFSPSFLLSPKGQSFLYYGSRPYRGKFILKNQSDSLDLVNLLPLDDYIKGTIKLEINPSWPEEAVRAQIVASRTYAVSNLGRHQETGYDFCSSSHCQNYGGVNSEDPAANRMVDLTHDIILTYQNQPAGVCFHSESGGTTDSAVNVWGKDVPYLVSVDSPWEKDSPHFSWEVQFTASELRFALEHAGLIQGEVWDLQVVSGSNGGRIKNILVKTDSREYQIPPNQFRAALGFDLLPSTFFEVRTHPFLKTQQAVITPEKTPIIQEEKKTENDESQGKSDYQAMMNKDWNLDDIISFLKMREKQREEEKNNQTILSETPDIQRPAETPVPDEMNGQPGDNELASGQTMVREEAVFIFRGRGYGHGVGLSQWGARGMALQGYRYQDILLHYFPGCQVKKARFK